MNSAPIKLRVSETNSSTSNSQAMQPVRSSKSETNTEHMSSKRSKGTPVLQRQPKGPTVNATVGLTKPAIRRLARKAGVKRVSAVMYDEVRQMFRDQLKAILSDALSYTELRKASTVQIHTSVSSKAYSGMETTGIILQVYDDAALEIVRQAMCEILKEKGEIGKECGYETDIHIRLPIARNESARREVLVTGVLSKGHSQSSVRCVFVPARIAKDVSRLVCNMLNVHVFDATN